MRTSTTVEGRGGNTEDPAAQLHELRNGRTSGDYNLACLGRLRALVAEGRSRLIPRSSSGL